MSTFSYELMQKPTSLLAAGVLINCLKIYDRSITGLRSSCEIEEVINRISAVAEHDLTHINHITAKVYETARNFEKEYGTLRNIKLVYLEEIKTMKMAL